MDPRPNTRLFLDALRAVETDPLFARHRARNPIRRSHAEARSAAHAASRVDPAHLPAIADALGTSPTLALYGLARYDFFDGRSDADVTVLFSQAPALFDDRSGTFAHRRRWYVPQKDALSAIGRLDDGLAALPTQLTSLDLKLTDDAVHDAVLAPLTRLQTLDVDIQNDDPLDLSGLTALTRLDANRSLLAVAFLAVAFLAVAFLAVAFLAVAGLVPELQNAALAHRGAALRTASSASPVLHNNPSLGSCARVLRALSRAVGRPFARRALR